MFARLAWVLVVLSVALVGPVWGQDGAPRPVADSSAAPNGAAPNGAASANADGDTTRSWQEDAWTPIVSHRGVDVTYIFYSEADNENNGVVLRLHNQNETPVRYDFTVIFRTPADERTAEVRGTLGPGEMKTGERDGLFWIPFPDGQSIGEIGIRGLDVSPTRS